MQNSNPRKNSYLLVWLFRECKLGFEMLSSDNNVRCNIPNLREWNIYWNAFTWIEIINWIGNENASFKQKDAHVLHVNKRVCALLKLIKIEKNILLKIRALSVDDTFRFCD